MKHLFLKMKGMILLLIMKLFVTKLNLQQYVKKLSLVIIEHINKNHLAGKFDDLKYLIKDKLNVLGTKETKIDASYPTSQFIIEGFSPPFRLDRNMYGGEFLIYLSDLIPCNQVKFIYKSDDIEVIFFEPNLRETR